MRNTKNKAKILQQSKKERTALNALQKMLDELLFKLKAYKDCSKY